MYEEQPPLTCWYFSYWSGVPSDGLEVHALQNRVVFAFPTNDGLFAVFIAWPRAELDTVRGHRGAIHDGPRCGSRACRTRQRWPA
jgi:hypothetical protein